MSRAALPEATKEKGASLATVIKWDDVSIKGTDGKIDAKQTRLAFSIALRKHLHSIGQTVRSVAELDWDALQQAALFVFARDVSNAGASLPLQHVVYGAVIAMQPPFAEFDRARKAVTEALSREGCVLELVRSKGVGQTNVKLRDGVDPKSIKEKATTTPIPWAELTSEEEEGEEEPEAAPAPTPAPTAAPAVVGHTAPNKPKKK